jgi:hypothetical protein
MKNERGERSWLFLRIDAHSKVREVSGSFHLFLTDFLISFFLVFSLQVL